MSRRFVLALDLVDDAKLIAQYEDWHRPQFRQPVPAAGPDGTWLQMERVFRLTDHPGR